MSRALQKIAFVMEAAGLRSAGQQLLDRFLTGYPRDGGFHEPKPGQIAVFLAGGATEGELGRRVKDFGLIVSPALEAALAGASAVVVAGKDGAAGATPELTRSVLNAMPAGAMCFVHGALAADAAMARAFIAQAGGRQIALLAGTSLAVTWRLPDVELTRGTVLGEALIVVQGPSPLAELDGLEGLLPVIERRRGGESGVQSVRALADEELWRAQSRGEWSGQLLAAALSRSNTPQGDPLKDGRTQDLAGLGLVPKLARHPRGWLLVHRDGLRTVVLALDGVVADYNFAVTDSDGRIISAQLYRPAAPGAHQFSRLATVVEDFFRTGRAPWPAGRSELVSGLLPALARAAAQPGQVVATPELARGYGV